MYGVQLNQINELFIQGVKQPTDMLRDTPMYKLIASRTDNYTYFETCHTFRLYTMPIPGSIQRELLFVDVSGISPDNIIRVTSIEGTYIRDTTPLQVIAVDLSAMHNPNPSYSEVANFFENYRKTIGDVLVGDMLLNERERLILTYYAAFAMVYINFDVDKETFLKIQAKMRSSTNKGCKPNNILFEKMKELIDTRYRFIDMNTIFLNFERGCAIIKAPEENKDVGTNNVQETGSVPDVPGEN